MNKTLARKLAAIGVSSIVALAAFEVGARVFARSHWDTQILEASRHSSEGHPLTVPAAEPAIRYRLRPGLDVHFLGARVLTDSAGVRVGTSPTSEAQGALRIALLGDSTSFGWGVAFEDSYGEQLRRALESRTGRAVVLRNYSVPGYNAEQECAAFLKTLPVFRPDLVIVHHDHNDWQPTGWNEMLSMAPEFGDNFLHSALVKLIERRLQKIRVGRELEAERGVNEFLGEYCVQGPCYEAMMESRKALIEALQKLSIPAVLVLFNSDIPADEHYEKNESYLRLHKSGGARLSAMGYKVLDLYPNLQRVLAESRASDLRAFWLDPEDHHPNARGHEFLATVLLDFLSSTPELESVLGLRR